MREVFSEKVGLRDYKVSVEDEKVLEGWRAQIEEILAMISTGSVNRDALDNVLHSDREFQQLLKEGGFRRKLGWVYERLEQGKLDEEDKKLLAIGLWLDREKGIFKFTPLIKRMLAGTNYKMEDVVKKWGLPDCINSSVLTREMANKFGISGEVKTPHGDRFGHRYFESASGKISDVWWGVGRAGFFESESDYEKNKTPYGKEQHKCDREPEK